MNPRSHTNTIQSVHAMTFPLSSHFVDALDARVHRVHAADSVHYIGCGQCTMSTHCCCVFHLSVHAFTSSNPQTLCFAKSCAGSMRSTYCTHATYPWKDDGDHNVSAFDIRCATRAMQKGRAAKEGAPPHGHTQIHNSEIERA